MNDMPIYTSGMIDKSILDDVLSIDNNYIEDEHSIEKHLCMLFDAINLIPKIYYSEVIPTDTNSLPEDFFKDKEQMVHVERAFAYELYHRWSCLLCGNNDGLMLNGEIGKYLNWFYGNGYDDNGKQKYPDIVLHKGQTENGQMIVCEIKKMDHVNDGIVDDLYKLFRFTCMPDKNDKPRYFNPYHWGIYLIINVEITKNNVEKPDNKKNCKINWEDKIANMIINNKKYMNDFLTSQMKSLDKTAKKILCVYSNWINKGNHNSEHQLYYQSLFNILSPYITEESKVVETVDADNFTK